MTRSAAPATIGQATLFGTRTPSIDPGFDVARVGLGAGAWIEHVPGWLEGDQTVAEEVFASTTWHAHRRLMYDRMVEVPRLTATIPEDGPGHPVFDDITACLVDRYAHPLERVSLGWYRDGQDSVAPHGDQVARTMHTTVMATVSCGAPRRFLLTPVDGGPSRSLDLGHGDLLVMGGTIQRTWRHGIPKTRRPVGARLCVMFRPPWLL